MMTAVYLERKHNIKEEYIARIVRLHLNNKQRTTILLRSIQFLKSINICLLKNHNQLCHL